MVDTAIWASKNDVKERMGVAQTAKGYSDSDIGLRLIRAERRVRAHLQTYVASDVIGVWTTDTVPDIVKAWTADLAAAFMFADFFGQSLRNSDERAGALYLNVEADLKALKKGEINVVDTSGDDVSPAEDTIASNKTDRTAHISLTHADDGDAGDGSLDDF